jgi:hypothetical protein
MSVVKLAELAHHDLNVPNTLIGRADEVID